MLERIKSLVPFTRKEARPKKENLQTAILKKALEVISFGGYREHNIRDTQESCSVRTKNSNGEEFRAWVRGTRGTGIETSDREYDLQVVRLNADGSADCLNIGEARMFRAGSFVGESLIFTAKHEDYLKRRTRDLSDREWEALAWAFLTSAVDKAATRQDFCQVLEADGEYITRGEVVLEWLKDGSAKGFVYYLH